MKQRQLEILLQQVPPPQNPTPNLEQYMTPAPIAADVLFTAYQWGDIEGKTVVDLGCGTGIFSVGAAYMGAHVVYGIDIDKKSIALAKEYAGSKHLSIKYNAQEVTEVTTRCDTVLMNPPFGAQKGNQNADRRFIEKGFEITDVIYSLHLTKTVPFLEKMIRALHGEMTYQKDYDFPIKWTFPFHEKKVMSYPVTLLRIQTHKSTSIHVKEPQP
ncbi:MAG TPA: METTL5 family protein [Candidatus Thermoplasmatota archaeon]|nr:METTL5 family protein [Candidatus Thermoplasmatota archaeon]